MPPSSTSSSAKSARPEPELITRRTRQRTRREMTKEEVRPSLVEVTDIDIIEDTGGILMPPSTTRPQSTPPSIARLPNKLTQEITKLQKRDMAILRKKAKWLKDFEVRIPLTQTTANLQSVVNATLVFAQEDAGTAVCIAPEGIILTCSHCVAESEEEFDDSVQKWLIFASGQVVKTKCIAWDPRRDLALLRVVASQELPGSTSGHPSPQVSASIPFPSFPFITLAAAPPSKREALICVGHPGSEDLEASKPGVKTDYDVLHVSTGTFRGYAAGQDIQDNSEIGALKHDCWTYWGHSGAPLVAQGSGKLVGLHSSWDDQTGMRRGVGFEALKAFLDEHVGP
ncbi:hypothetical protein CVT26_011594 [Gymnopilus dilepis]|uniref:Serine protease n=1 Tax=Gymnopilus dilepis TaxID=231916 RepID=A0A409VXW6_9AGAR|nr:hypothetical protein CVT26_011594 [Gymnopilus dilepis]